MEIWYEPGDRFAVPVQAARQATGPRPIEPRRVHREPASCRTDSFLSVYNELYHPANGANYIAIYLSPQLREAELVGVRPGQWLVRLIGARGARRALRRLDRARRPAAARPHRRARRLGASRRSSRSARTSTASTVSSLACGHRIVSVANLDEDGAADQPHQQPGADARRPPEARHRGAGHRHRRRARVRSIADDAVDGDDRDEHGEPVRRRRGRAHARREPEAHRRADRAGSSSAPPRPCRARTSRGGTTPGPGGSTRRAAWRRRVWRATGTTGRRSAVKLDVFQAGKGDCLLLTSADGKPRARRRRDARLLPRPRGAGARQAPRTRSADRPRCTSRTSTTTTSAASCSS